MNKPLYTLLKSALCEHCMEKVHLLRKKQIFLEDEHTVCSYYHYS